VLPDVAGSATATPADRPIAGLAGLPLGHRRAELAEPDRLASPHLMDGVGNRLQRHRLVGLLRDFHDAYRDSASPRCARCGWLILKPVMGVSVMRRRERCHLDNVMRCGLVWECPTCGAHIKAERAQEAEAVRKWHLDGRVATLGETGWTDEHKGQWAQRTSLMMTLTVRHGLGDDLSELRRGIARAWQHFLRNHWKEEADRFGLVGMIRAVEVTWGPEFGYHPHIHIAAFFRTPPDVAALHLAVYTKWLNAVCAVLGTRYAPASYRPDETGKLVPVGVVITRCDAASYLAKLGLEIAAPQTKTARVGHYAPLDFLAEFTETGDLAWLHRYQAYAHAMSGARQLTWSRGLKRAAGIGDLSDAELVAGAEQPTDELVTVIPAADFKTLRHIRGAVASLLELAERWGKRAADDYCRGVLAEFAGARAALERRGIRATAPP
jgi:hypothetical protein